MSVNNEKIVQIAKTCHEVNKTYCESLGDYSQKSWDLSPEWQKQSAINGVKFHLSNPTAGPSASHISWMKEKLDNGWVYGKLKDSENKTHPCLVSYEDLPIEQKLKDYFFISVIKSFI